MNDKLMQTFPVALTSTFSSFGGVGLPARRRHVHHGHRPGHHRLCLPAALVHEGPPGRRVEVLSHLFFCDDWIRLKEVLPPSATKRLFSGGLRPPFLGVRAGHLRGRRRSQT